MLEILILCFVRPGTYPLTLVVCISKTNLSRIIPRDLSKRKKKRKYQFVYTQAIGPDACLKFKYRKKHLEEFLSK